MADDIGYTPGAGATVGADEVAGVLYQRVKPVWGVDGSVVDASASNPLPVVQTGAVPAGTNNIGDVDVLTLPGVAGDVAHDAIDSGNPVKIGGKAIDFESMPTSVAVGDRVNAAYTPKGVAAVALFDPGTSNPIAALPVSIAAEVTITPLPAGTANIGDVDVASIAAGDNNIGNVDIVTLPAIPAGTNNIGDVDVLTLPGVAGAIAHDAPDSGNPVKVGGYAKDGAAPTSVADGDRVNMWLRTNGMVVVDIPNVIGVHDNGTALMSQGGVAHDAVGTGSNPLLVGGYASAAAPTSVSTDGDSVRAWFLRNGSLVNQLSAAGALIGGDATNGLDVDVTRLPALVAGSANIGDVDVASIAAGDNNIGNVDVVTLPALVAGSANIGDVDVLTVPADPFGATADASVAAGATGSISAKLRRATQGLEDLKTGIILAAGSAAIGKLAANSGVDIGDVDVLTLPNVTLAAGTNTNEVVGDVAEDAALAGNPQRIGFRASTAIPTAMSADNDIVTPWANRSGAPVVTQAPHVGLNSDPWNLVHEGAQYTTTQTSAVLVAGGASEKIVVTKIQIQAFDTVAGDVIVYFGTGAYARGTNRAIFDGTFKPSATSAPGVIMDGPFIAGTNGDDIMVTTTNNVDVTISCWYYVVI